MIHEMLQSYFDPMCMTPGALTETTEVKNIYRTMFLRLEGPQFDHTFYASCKSVSMIFIEIILKLWML